MSRTVVWLRVLPRTNLAYRSHNSITTFRINTCKSVSKQRTLTLFRINTYKKQGEGGTPTFARERQSLDWHSLPPSYARRSSSIPCGLNRLRILPVTTGVYPPTASVFSVPSVKGSGGSSFGEAQAGSCKDARHGRRGRARRDDAARGRRDCPSHVGVLQCSVNLSRR